MSFFHLRSCLNIRVALIASFCAAVPISLTAKVSYTINPVNNSSAQELAAQARIKVAMDSAIYFYNTYTTITKEVKVTYEPSVSTADGNSNGSIRFGSDKTYQVALTAMHEIAHTIGIGTTTKWQNLTDNNKVYNGVRGTKMLKEIDGPNAVLKGDDQHFWPYGLNYASEVTSVEDLIRHCRIVNEIYYDLNPEKEPPKTAIFIAVSSPTPCRSITIMDAGIALSVPARDEVTIKVVSLNGTVIGHSMLSTAQTDCALWLSKQFALPRGTYLFSLTSSTFSWRRQFTNVH